MTLKTLIFEHAQTNFEAFKRYHVNRQTDITENITYPLNQKVIIRTWNKDCGKQVKV